MIDDHQLAQSISALEAVRVLCVGDVMLDRFVYGVVERVSPEAPVPVLRVTHEKAMLGGAGNVVRNLVALRAECCFVSLLGRDGAGRDVTRLLGQETTVESHVQTVTDRPTTIKTRFVAGTQQILRSDEETADEIAAGDETKIVERATADLGQAKALVLSDWYIAELSDGFKIGGRGYRGSIEQQGQKEGLGHKLVVRFPPGAILQRERRERRIEEVGRPASWVALLSFVAL